MARIAQRSGANAVDHDRLSHEAPDQLGKFESAAHYHRRCGGAGKQGRHAATEKYPETPAKEVAAKNVAALVTRAPERAVETATCPVVRATGPFCLPQKRRRNPPFSPAGDQLTAAD